MTADPQTAHELDIGQVFEGKYKILRELGRGGFGMVYLAFQEGMDRHVALKVLKSSVTATAPSAKERFLREVKIISKLKHPNTVTIHDFGETYDGGLYMVLEYVEGETLKQILKRDGAQDPLRAADVCRQIARSLAEAHRHGVVHRDLKPANIMITSIESDKDFVKVLDFGVARLLDPKTNDLTSVGLPEGERELIGTPRYMSPEQVRGESLTGASDIYGLGLMLYETLSGEPAVQGDTTMGLITQQISPEPLRLPHVGHFHPTIQDVIRIATSKSVQDRFQTAEQMADALEQSIFQLKREQNVTGPQSGDVPMSSYQSQMGNMNPGWTPGSGWNSATPSGNWIPQSGPYDSVNQMDPRQTGPPMAGQNPMQSYGPHQPVQPQMPPGAHQHGPQQYGPQQPGGQPFPVQHGPPQPQGQQQDPYLSQQTQNPYQSGFNEIELPVDDDFKPTIQRDALDPGQQLDGPQALVGPNQPPNAESPGELPPLPDDDRPFAVEPGNGVSRSFESDDYVTSSHESIDQQSEPQLDDQARRPAASSRSRVAAAPEDDESLLEFSAAVLKVCVMATFAIIATYVSFLIIGAFLADHLNGTTRFIVSLVIALGMPVLAVIGEGSSRERFRVVERPLTRLNRVLLGAIVFGVAISMVLSAAFANNVVNHLTEQPNWFVANPDKSKGFPGLNRRVSHGAAALISDTMGAVGLYDKNKRAPGGGPKKRVAPLPKPTRKGNQQRRSRDDRPRSEIPDRKKDGDGNYVDW